MSCLIASTANLSLELRAKAPISKNNLGYWQDTFITAITAMLSVGGFGASSISTSDPKSSLGELGYP